MKVVPGKWRLIVSLIAIIICACDTLAAQGTVVAKADTSQIRIGEQFHLDLSATVRQGVVVSFPMLPDTFNHLEIVNKGKIDTSASKDSKELTLRQQLTLTGFDSGFFVIPPMPFILHEAGKNDTVFTEAMLIGVITVPVDTTKEIRPIKGIIGVPFPWMDYLLYLIGAVAVIALAIYLYKKFGKKEKVIRVPVVPNRPAHEIALEGLKRIETEKLWQQGYTKKYFSEVTDVIRQYIEGRFSVYAMEQTTDEILNHFSGSLIREEEKEKLKYMLQLADMVKFAKALPLPTDNENTMQFAYAFINNTRPVVREDFEKEEKK